MKLVIVSMILMGICCGNSYAMEKNDTYVRSRKLSQAVRYIKQGQEALKRHERALAFHCKQDDKFIIDFANKAKTLTKQIMDDKTVSPQEKQRAQQYFDEASLIIDSFNNKNK